MLRQVLLDTARLLAFRLPSAQIATRWPWYLGAGLAFTWLAGIGRYWDNPRAHLWQHLGLGSVAYVFVLAAILWLLIWPLRPKRWSYRNVLVFVTLTSPPALLYAIPVERFLSMGAAQAANAWFLAVVAAWRVALLFWFLLRIAGLRGWTIVVATLLPLALIVLALMVLNLEHVMFEFMAGIRKTDASGNDLAYQVVTVLGVLSFFLGPVLLLLYLVLAVAAWRREAVEPDEWDMGELDDPSPSTDLPPAQDI